jgi:regulator of sirC expression with transglutaminase-like and TPR domain
LNRVFYLTLLLLTLNVPSFAQTLVDPSKVAPEYREAAEKRRAEQIKQRDCAHKAEQEKVMPRERTAFLLQCLEADAGAK